MSVTRSIILLSLVTRVIAQSQSPSEGTFSIQTDPATPTSSALPSSSPSPSSSTGDQISAGLFPERCVNTCTPLADTFLNCGLSDLAGFNVSCLCTVDVENSFVDCVECALAADPNPQGAVANYQSLIDAYLQQCALASTTLPDATVQLPSSSVSGSGFIPGASASSSQSTSSMSPSSSTASSSSSSSAPLPSATSSEESTTSAPSSAGSAATSETPSNTASRGVDGRWTWMWGLTGVGGVVVAAALGV